MFYLYKNNNVIKTKITMENYLSTYDYVEGAEFEGLMPAAAEKVGVVGNSEEVVEMHGRLAKGMDALEVVDIEAAFEGGEEAEPAAEDAE